MPTSATGNGCAKEIVVRRTAGIARDVASLQENLTPRKLKKDTDWAENGEIIVKEQVQSEYWHTTSAATL